MKNLALQRIQNMKPYNPPLAGRRSYTGFLLDFNEKTQSPSSKIQEAIKSFLNSNTLQIYPEYGQLEKKIANYVGLNQENVLITNGSDQGIDLIFRTFTDAGDKVIIPQPSFAMFSQCAQIVGNKILSPLYAKEDLSFPLSEVLSLVNDSVKLVVICNPNNPTGSFVSVNNIEKIAQKSPNTILLIDEAYFEFSEITAIPLIKKYPNIIVARTLSKAFGLPSLRVGYIIASEICVKELEKVRGPYDVNMIAYCSAIAAFDDLETVKKYSKEIMTESKPLVEAFFTKNNINFYTSQGNFLLYKPIIKDEEKTLRDNGILVRSQNKINIENTSRLTIGTVKQMKKFIKIYKEKILPKLSMQKVAFIDRDGTLIFEPQDTFQIDSIEKLKILDGAIKGLQVLIKNGYQLVMITNQDGLATKSFPKEDFDAPQQKMLQIFKENGITFKEIFICPHFEQENCLCRKPKLGLLEKFLKKQNMDKSKSLVIGDRTSDKFLAKNMGIKYVAMETNGNFYKAVKEVVL